MIIFENYKMSLLILELIQITLDSLTQEIREVHTNEYLKIKLRLKKKIKGNFIYIYIKQKSAKMKTILSPIFMSMLECHLFEQSQTWHSVKSSK